MTTVKIDDLRTSGIGTCARARDWCRRNGISFHKLRTEGIKVEDIPVVDDQRDAIELLIAHAEQREKEEAHGRQ